MHKVANTSPADVAELDYLCNLCKVQVSPHSTSSDISQKYRRKKMGKVKLSVVSSCKTIPVWGGCLIVVINSLTPKELKDYYPD